jgi:hypothetical protein
MPLLSMTFPHAFQSPKMADETRLYMAPIDSMFSNPWFSSADGLRSSVKRFHTGCRPVGVRPLKVGAVGSKRYADSASRESLGVWSAAEEKVAAVRSVW